MLNWRCAHRTYSQVQIAVATAFRPWTKDNRQPALAKKPKTQKMMASKKHQPKKEGQKKV